MRNNYSKSERLDMMKNNLKRNCPDIIFDDWMFPVFEKLSIIEFDDVIVEYSSYDNCLDFWFYIGEYKFSIVSFDDDPDYIVFTVHHDKELLVSDEMNIDDFWMHIKVLRCMSKSELCKKILYNNGGNVELYTAEEQKTIEHFIKLGWIKICFNADNSKSYKITYSGKDQIRFDSQIEDLEKVMDTITTFLYES